MRLALARAASVKDFPAFPAEPLAVLLVVLSAGRLRVQPAAR